MSWIVLDGELFQTEAAEVQKEPFVKPYPESYYILDEDNQLNLVTHQFKSKLAFSYPYPLSYWKISSYVNEGFPYLDIYKGIEKIEPPRRYDVLRLNENVRVISPPHGLDKIFPITKMEIPLDKPEETKYTLNEEKKTTLTEKINQANMEVFNEIRNQPTLTTMLQAAKNNATQLIKSASGGYVTLKRADDGTITEILISDEADYTVAQKIWRWNVNGLGYSNTGYNGEFGLAMTMDGAIVADHITSGTMYADHVRGGILTMGGIDNVNGIIRVEDGDGEEICLFNETGGMIKGVFSNVNPDNGRILQMFDGKISSFEVDDAGKRKEVAYINSTYIYEGRKDPSISLMGDGLTIYCEWLGIAEHKDSVIFSTQPKAKVEFVTDVKLKSDGTLDVKKSSIDFMKGIMITNELPSWN